jgi:hypothetical protein
MSSCLSDKPAEAAKLPNCNPVESKPCTEIRKSAAVRRDEANLHRGATGALIFPE